MAEGNATYGDMGITAARIEPVPAEIGALLAVFVTLEDGSERCALVAPTGLVHLEPANFVGRTYESAHLRAMCWLQGARRGIHRIVGVMLSKYEPPNPDPDLVPQDGTWEAHGLLSDSAGTWVRLFGYVPELLRTDLLTDLLDLTVEEARSYRREYQRGYEPWAPPPWRPAQTFRRYCLNCRKPAH